MKSIVLQALLWLSLLADGALAEMLPVSSGEHDGFSRLVIRLPAGTAWRIADARTSVRVIVELAGVTFDTSRVFRRIPRTRLASLAQPKPGQPLQLNKNCRCSVRAFVQSHSLLVIDLVDPKDAPGIQISHRAAIGQTPYRFRLPQSAGIRVAAPANRRTLSFAPRRSDKIKPPAENPVAAFSEAPTLLALPDIEHFDLLKLSESRLLEQIGRAADQGLLQPTTRPAGPVPPVLNHGGPRRPDIARKFPPIASLAAITSADRDMEHLRIGFDQAPVEISCLDPETVAIGTWADGRPFGIQVGELRSSLYTEFDATNRGAAIDLAKLYLHFGFGTEALSVLAAVKDEAPDIRVLKTLARLIDSIPRTGPNALAGQDHCNTDISFWSFLAQPNGATVPGKAGQSAILRAFSALPTHLKSLLGPRVSRRFMASGDTTTAEVILRMENRASPEVNAGSELARAELDLEHGKTSVARRRLQDVLAGNSGKSPEALVQLVEAQLASDATVAADVPELVAAFAIEYRGSELGDRLHRTQALALGLSGKFRQSFGIIADIAAADNSGEIVKTRDNVLRLLTERSDDIRFLSLALPDLGRENAVRPVALGNAMARRFIDLGFPDAAAQVLSEPVVAHDLASRRVMRAEIALMHGLPNRALAELAGLSGEAEQRLRGRAMMMTGEFAGSAEAYLKVPAPELAARSYWLSGDLSDAATRGSGKYQTAAEIALDLSTSAKTAEPVGDLAAASRLLRESQQARAQISRMLTTVASKIPAG